MLHISFQSKYALDKGGKKVIVIFDVKVIRVAQFVICNYVETIVLVS